MKYIFSILIFTAISLPSLLIAQPSGYNALGIFQIDLNDASNCFEQSDYPTVDDLVDDLLIQYLGYSFCTSNCPYQPLPSCTAILLDQNDVVVASNNQWCFNADPEFQWICGPAPVQTDPATTTNTQVNVVDLPFGDMPDPLILHATAQKIITGIFQNPSKGKMQLLLDHQYGRLPELMIITNWSGKKVQTAPLKLEPHIINKINLDLSDQPEGFYLATFYSADGWMKTGNLCL